MHSSLTFADSNELNRAPVQMPGLHTELCCSPSFRLQSADDASADTSDLPAPNVLVVQTDNSHSASVTSVTALLNQRHDVKGARERLSLCNNKS